MLKSLYENYKKTDLCFCLGHRTPQKNEFERGCKYFLLWGYSDNVNLNETGWQFRTLKEARNWIKNNYFIFL